ncbi:nuclear transport factor 2 family protein [Pusillimonas sp.]|uniref:nuclear transport factor 2 family protein n=1 Tax=Pusillimonas sp. TaxID=3040095 RepID=UPI0037CC43A6
MTRLTARLETLEAQDAVRRLQAEYMQACDDKRGRAVADLFWADGIWEGTGGSRAGKVRGMEAIAAMFESSPSVLTFTVHYLTNESITVEGDRATGRWKLFEPCTYQNIQALWMGGRYENIFERRNGVWKILHLKLDVEFRTPYERGWLQQRHAVLTPTASEPPAQTVDAVACRAIDHISLTVPSLRQATDFFVSVFGADLLYRREAAGNGSEAFALSFGVDPRAGFKLAKLVLAGVALELFEYYGPDLRSRMSRNCDPGGSHFCIEVFDMDAAIARLAVEPDVRLLGEPSVLPEEHPLAGRRWIYFLTPWGQQLELVCDRDR